MANVSNQNPDGDDAVPIRGTLDLGDGIKIMFSSHLIFDSFKSVECAENFMSAVKVKYNLDAQRFDSQDQSDGVEPFPFELYPPIVLVKRPDLEPGDERVALEEQIEEFVTQFDGVFAGT